MKSLFFIVLISIFSFSIYADSSYNTELKTLDNYIRLSKLKSASKMTLLMLNRWGDQAEILERASRLTTLSEMENYFNKNYTFNLPWYLKRAEERHEFYRKFSNPSSKDILAGFIATATVYLGVKYVTNWVDYQSNPSNDSANTNVVSIQVKTGGWISIPFDDFYIRLFKKTGGNTSFIKDITAGTGFFETGYASFFDLSKGSYTFNMVGTNNGKSSNYGSGSFSYYGGRKTCIVEMAEMKMSCN